MWLSFHLYKQTELETWGIIPGIYTKVIFLQIFCWFKSTPSLKRFEFQIPGIKSNILKFEPMAYIAQYEVDFFLLFQMKVGAKSSELKTVGIKGKYVLV